MIIICCLIHRVVLDALSKCSTCTYRSCINIVYFVYYLRLQRYVMATCPRCTVFFALFRPIRDCLTRMGTSQLQEWGCKFWPFLGTYCDKGQLSSSRTPDTLTCCRAFSSWHVATCFNDLGVLRLGFKHSP